jgi:hypothetical protein
MVYAVCVEVQGVDQIITGNRIRRRDIGTLAPERRTEDYEVVGVMRPDGVCHRLHIRLDLRPVLRFGNPGGAGSIGILYRVLRTGAYRFVVNLIDYVRHAGKHGRHLGEKLYRLILVELRLIGVPVDDDINSMLARGGHDIEYTLPV